MSDCRHSFEVVRCDENGVRLGTCVHCDLAFEQADPVLRETIRWTIGWGVRGGLAREQEERRRDV